MYQYRYAPVGLKPRQVTIITPACPICGQYMYYGRQRVVATERRVRRKREYIHAWKSFEICATHDVATATQSLGLQLGIDKPQLMEELS